MNTEISYAIVRVVPDSLRDETLNIGIVAEFGSAVVTRFLKKATQPLKGLAPPTVVNDCLSMETRLMSWHERFQSGAKVKQGQFIGHVFQVGIDGFVISKPGKMELREPSIAAAHAAVDRLYKDLVSPRVWPTTVISSSSVRAVALLGRAIKATGVGSEYYARDVRIKPEGFTDTLEFNLAYANGKLNLGTVVDLDLESEDRRLLHVYRSVAVNHEVRELLGPSTLELCTVVKTTAEPQLAERYLEHLRLISDVICLPADTERLVRKLKAEATTPIYEGLKRALNGDIESSKHVLTVNVHRPLPALAGGT